MRKMGPHDVIDYSKKMKQKIREQADPFRESFERTGAAFIRKHFRLSIPEFIEYVKRERRYPPVEVPFTPFGEAAIPEVTYEIWKEMEAVPAFRELLDEDPIAFLIELGKRFNRKLREERSG